jgi:hypothetical protein
MDTDLIPAIIRLRFLYFARYGLGPEQHLAVAAAKGVDWLFPESWNFFKK